MQAAFRPRPSFRRSGPHCPYPSFRPEPPLGAAEQEIWPEPGRHRMQCVERGRARTDFSTTRLRRSGRNDGQYWVKGARCIPRGNGPSRKCEFPRPFCLADWQKDAKCMQHPILESAVAGDAAISFVRISEGPPVTSAVRPPI